ncbi:hypothetical protein P7C70_g7767, partial [Phenoliferia sp. Uapishka_3]
MLSISKVALEAIVLLLSLAALVWFVPALKATLLSIFIKMEAEHLADEQVEELQKRAGLGRFPTLLGLLYFESPFPYFSTSRNVDGTVDLGDLLDEKNAVSGAGLEGKLKSL